MAKMIGELEVGDKVFIIDKNDWVFDVAEVIESDNALIKVQFYINGGIRYFCKYNDFTIYETSLCIIFTDEKQALDKFEKGLKNGSNR